MRALEKAIGLINKISLENHGEISEEWKDKKPNFRGSDSIVEE